MKSLHSPHTEGLERYLSRLGEHPPLPADEVARIAKEASEGCLEAQEALVLAHLSLVAHIAFRYGGYGLPLADLISEGNLGLLRAAELFNPAFGVAFPTYAGVWIKQRIHRAITAQAQVVRIPVWRSQRLRKLDRIHEQLNAELGCDAPLSELAERIGIPEEELASITAERLQVDSLENEPHASRLAAQEDERHAEPGEKLSQEELFEEVAACLHGLDDTELHILTLRFGLLPGQPAQSYRSMSAQFGKSREWIRKIGERALAKIKDSLRQAGDLPRGLVAARKERVYNRMKRLSRNEKKEPNDSSLELSLFPVVLTPSIERLLFILCS